MPRAYSLITKYQTTFWEEVTGFGGTVFFMLLVVFFIFIDSDFALKLFLAYLITFSVAIVIRIFHFKNRPKEEPQNTFFQKLDASSFPSVHASRASALFVMSALKFPQKEFLWLFGTVALFVCLSRITLKKHFLTDILGGIVLGSLTGYLLISP